MTDYYCFRCDLASPDERCPRCGSEAWAQTEPDQSFQAPPPPPTPSPIPEPAFESDYLIGERTEEPSRTPGRLLLAIAIAASFAAFAWFKAPVQEAEENETATESTLTGSTVATSISEAEEDWSPQPGTVVAVMSPDRIVEKLLNSLGQSDVFDVNVTDSAIELAAGLEPTSVDLMRSGPLVIASQGLGELVLVSPDGSQTTHLGISAASPFAVSPNGLIVAAGNLADDTGPILINRSGDQLAQLPRADLFPVSSASPELRWSPDSRLLAQTDGSQFAVWDTWTGELLAIGSGALRAVGPDLVAVWWEGIMEIRSLTGYPVRTFPGTPIEADPSGIEAEFSPGGDLIAIVVPDDVNQDQLWVVSARDRFSRRLGPVQQDQYKSSLAWSGTGNELFFVRDRDVVAWTGSAETPVVGVLPRAGTGSGLLRVYDRATLPDDQVFGVVDGSLEARDILGQVPMHSWPEYQDVIGLDTGHALASAGPGMEPSLVILGADGTSTTVAKNLPAGCCDDLVRVAQADDGRLLIETAGNRVLLVEEGSATDLPGRFPTSVAGEPVYLNDDGVVDFGGAPYFDTSTLLDTTEILALAATDNRLLIMARTEHEATALYQVPSWSRGLAQPFDNPPALDEEGTPRPILWFLNPITEAEVIVSSDETSIAIGTLEKNGWVTTLLQGPHLTSPQVCTAERMCGLPRFAGKPLTFSPGDDWMLVHRADSIVAVSRFGRGEFALAITDTQGLAWISNP